VPLLLIDLDNTLIDRTGAFGRWARDFVSARDGSEADVRWLSEADRDGLRPRKELAALAAERFALNAQAATELLADLHRGMVSQLTPDDSVTEALRRAAPGGRMDDRRLP
jgi:putative hydrolase of the HAD superfamily